MKSNIFKRPNVVIPMIIFIILLTYAVIYMADMKSKKDEGLEKCDYTFPFATCLGMPMDDLPDPSL